MAGSFEDYKNAIDYQTQMKVRGFEDAFIVTYKNGERISLNVAIKTEKSSPITEQEDVLNKPVETEKPLNLEFTVQIFVGEDAVSPDELKKMSKLGNIDKEAEGTDMYRYFVGPYKTLEEANIQLEKVKLAGYADAFVFTKLEGERITLEQAKELLKE